MSAAVSIIVPCYNVAPYLDKCMESLTLQTLGDLEIISVNDRIFMINNVDGL